MTKYVLALDQGTSSSRSIVFDDRGRAVAMAQREFRQIYPQPGWVEHDPEEIWSSQLATAQEALAKAGLKATDKDLGPAIPAADKAILDGKLEPVAKLLTGAVHEGLHKKFEEVQARKNYAKDDVAAGREYVKAYVEFVHYVEGVHAAASGEAGEHAHDEAKPTAHEHH